MATRNIATPITAHRQRGAALLILLTIILLAASYTLLKRLNREPVEILRTADSVRVLGEARDALVGYALSANPPGLLPCPDYGSDGNYDGLSDPCVEAGSSVTAGRLPWQTLGLADPRDSAGERLWYSPAKELDGNYIINSETTAGLRVDGNAAQVAAVIIAPGATLDNQSRPPNFAAQDDPTRYLEDANSIADNNFVSAPTGAAVDFNDQLAVIYRDDLLQGVERRVLAELKGYLSQYYATNGYYPYPAALNTSDCSTLQTQGHLPEPAKSGDCGALAEWDPGLPSWFSSQGWNRLVWYAPAPACTQASPGCSGSGFIEVLNTTAPTDDKQAVLIAVGPALAGQSRPAASESDLFESIENGNGDAVFEKLPIDGSRNDQILVVAP